MDVGEGYRIPKLEEFVQGFEFEVASTHKMLFFDMSGKGETIESNPVTSWIPCKVWWKNDPDARILEVDGEGNTFEYSGRVANFFKPFSEKSYIEQGLVRVKIK